MAQYDDGIGSPLRLKQGSCSTGGLKMGRSWDLWIRKADEGSRKITRDSIQGISESAPPSTEPGGEGTMVD